MNVDKIIELDEDNNEMLAKQMKYLDQVKSMSMKEFREKESFKKKLGGRKEELKIMARRSRAGETRSFRAENF